MTGLAFRDTLGDDGNMRTAQGVFLVTPDYKGASRVAIDFDDGRVFLSPVYESECGDEPTLPETYHLPMVSDSEALEVVLAMIGYEVIL